MDSFEIPRLQPSRSGDIELRMNANSADMGLDRFFKQVEEIEKQIETINRHLKNLRHGEPCVSRLVKKEGPNLDRKFYVCDRSETFLATTMQSSCINNVSSRHDPNSSNGSDVHPNDPYFDELGDHDGDEE